ncbi:MAG: hypothetical protein RL341_2250 [Pseudomonadota bacterium]|jgi:uncharacterized membrane protein YecN with MAPEG domain
MTTLTMPHITLLFAACAALFQVALTALVIAHRAQKDIPFLDGGDTALLRRMRAHGNFTETMPIALLLLGLLELHGLGSPWLWTFGAALMLGRLVHAYGLLTPGVLWARVSGMLATLAVISIQAIACLWIFIV